MEEAATPPRSDRLAKLPEWLSLVLVFAAACALVVSRRPDAILNPQFYMEDGSLWYTQAHELGWLRAMLAPARGYFQTSARLGAALALAVPLAYAPLVMTVAAIGAEALPAVVIASERFARVIPSRPARLFLALLSVCLPNAWTTIANLTHAQWYLAVAAMLVVLSAPAEGRFWRGFDAVVLALSGLSGPLSIFLLPVAALKWWVRRERWALVQTAIVGACAVVQVVALLLASETGLLGSRLGASVSALVQVLARQVVYGAFVGQAALAAASADSVWLRPGVTAAVGLAVLALVALAAARAPLELRLMIVFAALTVAAALVYPPVPGVWWELLQNPGFASRYFIVPTLTIATVLVWALGRGAAARAAAVAGLAVMLAVGVRLDWRQPALQDFGFAESVASYERAAPGQRVHILYPPGWDMVLTKRER